jgi:hypothetical protein
MLILETNPPNCYKSGEGVVRYSDYTTGLDEKEIDL